MMHIAEACWPLARAGEALLALAERTGLSDETASPVALGEVARPSSHQVQDHQHWLAHCATLIGVELEEFDSPYADVSDAIRQAAPALLSVHSEDKKMLLAIVATKKRQLLALSPEGNVVRIDVESVRAALCNHEESTSSELAEQLLAQSAIPSSRRRAARGALLAELMVERRINCGHLLRCTATASLSKQARELRLGRKLATMLAAHTGYFLLWICSWSLLGSIALAGRLELGWLTAWALVLLALVPLRLLVSLSAGRFAVGASVLIKRRLLYGTLQLDGDLVRRQGAGSLLGRILETEVLDTMALTGGFLSLTAAVELLLSLLVLAYGAASVLHVLALVLVLLLTGLFCRAHYRMRRRWTDNRFVMTDDLVERMVGHRTRLAQQAQEHWHDDEDQLLAQYGKQSQQLDRTSQRLKVLPPRGWLLVSLLALAPAFVFGQVQTFSLAISVGGILLAYSALRHLVEGAEQLCAAAVACRQLAMFWGQPAEQSTTPVTYIPTASSSSNGAPLIDAQEIVYRYGGRKQAVLRGVNLQIHRGDQLLLEGDSGSGKSTLAAVLADLRIADSGLLLLDGLDRQSVCGESWRRHVVLAPQFHENHVLMGPLAFNLLMGRRWPPEQDDLAEAARVCGQLGLTPLLERMPGGLFQLVGETGWQLSHGEKSRLYLARALLQGTDLVILDESLAALDPKTLQQTADCVLSAAGSLLVVAHP